MGEVRSPSSAGPRDSHQPCSTTSFRMMTMLLAAAACVSAVAIAQSRELAELEGPLTKDIEVHAEGRGGQLSALDAHGNGESVIGPQIQVEDAVAAKHAEGNGFIVDLSTTSKTRDMMHSKM